MLGGNLLAKNVVSENPVVREALSGNPLIIKLQACEYVCQYVCLLTRQNYRPDTMTKINKIIGLSVFYLICQRSLKGSYTFKLIIS